MPLALNSLIRSVTAKSPRWQGRRAPGVRGSAARLVAARALRQDCQRRTCHASLTASASPSTCAPHTCRDSRAGAGRPSTFRAGVRSLVHQLSTCPSILHEVEIDARTVSKLYRSRSAVALAGHHHIRRQEAVYGKLFFHFFGGPALGGLLQVARGLPSRYHLSAY